MMEIFGWGKNRKREAEAREARRQEEERKRKEDYFIHGSFHVVRATSGEYVFDSKSPVRSEKLKEAYPALFNEQEEVSIGILNIDVFGIESREQIQQGKSPLAVGKDLYKGFEEGLRALAMFIKENPENPIAKIEYFIGYSRLSRLGESFGFDVFDDDVSSQEGEGKSVALAQTAHDLSEKDEASIANPPPKGHEQYAVISREELLERYGTK